MCFLIFWRLAVISELIFYRRAALMNLAALTHPAHLPSSQNHQFGRREKDLCPQGCSPMETARMMPGMQILGLFLLCLRVTAVSHRFHRSMMRTSLGPFIPHDYLRVADVARHCHSVLSSADELTVDADRGTKALLQELSFAKGDWRQDAGNAPLMPFHGGGGAGSPEACSGSSSLEAIPLATLMLAHVDAEQRQSTHTRRALNISGVLSLTISRRCCFPEMPRHRHLSPEFKFEPGVSKLNILLEGVYTETRSSSYDGGENGGEKVLCMVGNAVLPVRGRNSTDPWGWAKEVGAGNFEPPVMADSNIVLVLRYPEMHTLTTRAVRGEMTSTSAKSDDAYFDAVRLVSRPGQHAGYQFRPEDEALAVTGCGTRPFFCNDDDGGVAVNSCAGGLYRGISFCDILHEFAPPGHGMLASVLPNWKCNSTDEFCTRLGPFVTGGGATDRVVTDFAVAMQDVRCEPASEPDGKPAALVSAVFRAVSPWEDQNTAMERTGLTGATLSAEGAWRSSTGQLCMTGCLDAGNAACRHRVAMYVPTTLSITRRGIIMGRITAMDGSHFPLLFQKGVPPRQSWNRLSRTEDSLPMEYSYEKVEHAGELLRRSEPPSGFRSNSVAKSLLSYPKKRTAGVADDMTSLSYLSDDLRLQFLCLPKLQFMQERIKGSDLNLLILSIGRLVGTYDPSSQFRGGSGSSMPLAQNDTGHGVPQQEPLLNVSAELTVPRSWAIYRVSPPVMSLEGVYSPEDGRMHLIGCRNVRAPWRVVSMIGDLENGMDCSIEVRIEYPPTTTMRWLFSPTAKVYVSSTRAAGDPLHFNRTELHSLPVSYHGNSDVLTRQNQETVEGLLCIAVLSATIAAALSQLRYMRSHPDVAPYVSLAMLGVQALGHGVALVTEAKMLPAWPTHNYRMYIGHLHWDMDSSVRALTLAALLLTLRIAQKVRRSRIRARAGSPLEPGRVPSDGPAVLLYSIGAHLGAVLLVVAVHWLCRTYGAGSSTTSPPQIPHVVDEQAEPWRPPTSYMRTRGAVVERYVGLVKEWFLLPQVVGNAVWRVNCRPLGKRYYAGVTGAWLLPHVYGYLRPPAVNMYGHVPDDVMDFYAKVCDVGVPLVAVVLALSVYAQHRWNYKIVGWAMGREQNKLQHVS